MNPISLYGLLAVVFFSLLPMAFESSHPEEKKSYATSSGQIIQTDTTREYKEAPDFTLETMNGEPFTLSDHEGKVIVINIWATWCAPCRKEIPDFIKMQRDMRDQGVLFVGVSVDEKGWEAVRPYARKMDINYPVMVDDGSVFEGYGPFQLIPTSYIINKKGELEYVAPGMLTEYKLKPILEELVNR